MELMDFRNLMYRFFCYEPIIEPSIIHQRHAPCMRPVTLALWHRSEGLLFTAVPTQLIQQKHSLKIEIFTNVILLDLESYIRNLGSDILDVRNLKCYIDI